MINEKSILSDFSKWLVSREEKDNVLTNLKTITNDYGTGWEHWLKYELSLMLKATLSSEYKVEPEHTVEIDGRGLEGKTTKRIDLAVSSTETHEFHLFEIKCGWLIENEIDDYLKTDIAFNKQAEKKYLWDLYYLTKILSAEKGRGTFVFAFFSDRTGDIGSKPATKSKVDSFIERLRKELGEYTGIDQNDIDCFSDQIDEFFLSGYSI